MKITTVVLPTVIVTDGEGNENLVNLETNKLARDGLLAMFEGGKVIARINAGETVYNEVFKVSVRKA